MRYEALQRTGVRLSLLKDNAASDGIAILPQLMLQTRRKAQHQITCAHHEGGYILHDKALAGEDTGTTPSLEGM